MTGGNWPQSPMRMQEQPPKSSLVKPAADACPPDRRPSANHGHLVDDEIIHTAQGLLNLLKATALERLEVTLHRKAQPCVERVAVHVVSCRACWSCNEEMVNFRHSMRWDLPVPAVLETTIRSGGWIVLTLLSNETWHLQEFRMPVTSHSRAHQKKD